MSPGPSTKLDRFGTSVFSRMTELAQRHRAINLGQGVPDLPPPGTLLRAAARHLREGPHQYAPSPGVEPLRQAVARTYRDLYSLDYDPGREVTIGCGATQLLHAAINGLCESGDRILVIEPCYDSYIPCAVMAGAEAVSVQLRPPDYRLRREELEKAFEKEPRLVLVNTPHNPTGRVFGRDELTLIRDLVLAHDTLVVSDEVYEHLTFDDHRHVPFATYPGMHERTITISSVSKTFGVTGWRVGWACAPEALTSPLRRCHQFVTFAAPTPLQLASADALDAALATNHYAAFRAEMGELRDDLVRGLEGTGLRPLPVQGTYFLLADYGDLCSITDESFCERITSEVGVNVIPLSPFSSTPDPRDTVIRFCFARRSETIQEAISRLALLREKASTWVTAGA
jgi:aspartate/methionine/tyrosine aminotransferase